jgi:hypothetical protein
VEGDKPKKSESVGQTLPQLPWKQKMGDLNGNQGTKCPPNTKILRFGRNLVSK